MCLQLGKLLKVYVSVIEKYWTSNDFIYNQSNISYAIAYYFLCKVNITVLIFWETLQDCVIQIC